MRLIMKKLFFVCLFSLLAISPAFAAGLTVPAVFSDNMVVQQDMVVPVWGKGDAGDNITVTLDKYTAKSVVGQDGKWRCDLPKMTAGGPFTMTIAGKTKIDIANVLIGEVWFCSGQSNMDFELSRVNNAGEEIKAANYPTLRLFTARQVVAGTPQDNVPGKWIIITPENAAKITALGYFFGREIIKSRKVPVGLVQASCGWTPAESWMSREALMSDPDFHYIVKRWDDSAAPDAKAKYDQAMIEWKTASDTATKDGKPLPVKPLKPADPNFIHRASGLWNGSVFPLIPYAIRGAIWYQGETNEVRAHQYRKLFSTLITYWRKAWGIGDFPFLFVQVASVLPPDPVPIESEWAELRESQAMALKLPNTGMAVTVDIGDEKDVHPKNKQDVGLRLGLVARAKVYGEKKLEYSGPQYKSMKVKNGQAVLSFDYIGKGLVVKGGEPLKGFYICGPDKKFVTAQAKISGKNVIVWSDAVKEPVSVRYAWANNPMGCNLFNKADLPAVPFRTDDWPGKTVGFTALTIDNF
jgi:sialate O-acetylesterase